MNFNEYKIMFLLSYVVQSNAEISSIQDYDNGFFASIPIHYYYGSFIAIIVTLIVNGLIRHRYSCNNEEKIKVEVENVLAVPEQKLSSTSVSEADSSTEEEDSSEEEEEDDGISDGGKDEANPELEELYAEYLRKIREAFAKTGMSLKNKSVDDVMNMEMIDIHHEFEDKKRTLMVEQYKRKLKNKKGM